MQLEVCFGNADVEGSYPLFVDGNAVGSFLPPLTAESLDELIDHLRSPVLVPGKPMPLSLQELGQKLFDALFGHNQQLAQALERTPEGGRVLLVFDRDAAELLRLPWEHMTDRHGDPLATGRALVRRVAGLREVELPPVGDRPLRLLVVIAEPADQARFDARWTYSQLLEELSPLAEQGLLEVEFLPPPTSPEALSTRLTERRYDILHLVCHGYERGLALEGDHGETRAVTGDRLRALLKGKGIRLVLLTSCLTAAVQSDLRSSIATTLLEGGVPEVVAMQFPALVKPALKFVGDVYRAMAGDWRASIDKALLLARQGGFFDQQEGVYQWGVPVIYLQDSGLSLFGGDSEGAPGQVSEWPELTVTNLPQQPNLVGRGNNMVEVNRALATARLVVLTGTPGIGKTELAKAVGHYAGARGRYEGGILWVDLEQADTLDLFLSSVATVAGAAFEAGREPLMQLSQRLHGWGGLFVLDNLDTALEGPERDQVRDALSALVEGTKAPRFLITSRATVEAGEKTVRVGPMRPQEAVALFLARADQAEAQPRPDDLAKMAEITELLDNHPLSIVLAAAHSGEMSAGTLLGALEEKRMQLLALPSRKEHTRLTSLEVSLGLSYERLPPEAKRLFGALSVFVAGAQAFVLDDLCGEGWREPMGELLRRSLVELHLVPWLEPPERYVQLAPVRDYAQRTLPADQLDGRRLRAAEYYLDLARTGNRMLEGEDAAVATMLMDLELPNMRAAMDWTAGAATVDQKRAKLTVDYAFALNPFLDQRGYWEELAQRLEEGAGACESLDDQVLLAGLKLNLATAVDQLGDVDRAEKLRDQVAETMRNQGGEDWATYLHQVAGAAARRGDYGEARRLLQESLALRERLGDRGTIADTLHNLGKIAHLTCGYEEAKDLYRQSLEIREEAGDVKGVAYSLGQLGIIAMAQGRYEDARENFLRTLQISETLGDRVSKANALHQLSHLAQATGDYDEALGLSRRALRIRDEVGHYLGKIDTLGQLGGIYALRGDVARAGECYSDALELSRAAGYKSTAAKAIVQLGFLAQQAGNYDEAREMYEEALRSDKELGDRAGTADALQHLGMVAQLTGAYPDARRFYSQALSIREELGHRPQVAQSLHNLAGVAQLMGRYGEARELYQQSLEICEELGNTRGVAYAVGQLGTLQLEHAQYEEARKSFHTVLEISEQLGDKASIARARHYLGIIAHVTGRHEEAERLHVQSLDLLEELGDKQGVASAVHQLGMLAQHRRDYAVARAFYERSLTIREELGDREGVASSLAQLGMLAAEQGLPEEAVVYWLRAAAIFQEIGSPRLGFVLRDLGYARRFLGDRRYHELENRARPGETSSADPRAAD